MENLNLHDLNIIRDDGVQPLQDFSIKTKSPHFDSVEVLFRNQEQKLLEIIREYEKGAIFGCVAWLTSIPILKAFARCKNVQIIVQKEDFLRPDLDTYNIGKWREELQRRYKDVTCNLKRFQLKEPVGKLSVLGDPTVEGIRCVGNYNFEKKPAFPRAHHKFLVFCTVRKNVYKPIALWTGSFNLTRNATQSFDNVLYFTDSSGENEIINSFLREHHQIFAISEQLDWENIWATPEFRIGT